MLASWLVAKTEDLVPVHGLSVRHPRQLGAERFGQPRQVDPAITVLSDQPQSSIPGPIIGPRHACGSSFQACQIGSRPPPTSPRRPGDSGLIADLPTGRVGLPVRGGAQRLVFTDPAVEVQGGLHVCVAQAPGDHPLRGVSKQ